ncbi:MAG: transglycosylase domain-containing protein [Methyloligellaceae bacterium]
MRDWNSGNKKKKTVDWLALDARLDSSMYDTLEDLRNRWSAYSDFLARFHYGGVKRVIAEILSEGVTLCTAGLVLMLCLAMPAFEETNKNWRKPGEYSVTFLDRYGNFIGKKGVLHDDAVPLEEIPKHMIQATLATEDRRFYQHIGVDFLGTFRALIENVRAQDNVQGGSTITQQLAKNLFLSSDRNLTRKIKEAFLALWLEGHFTKDEILKLYLDRAYLGGGNLGVEAASQYYYDKSVRDITLAEAAILAGMYKAPSKYAPHVNLPNARARANEVLSNMVEAGYMTEGQIYGARINPASVVEKPEIYVPHYFLDWAFDETRRIAKNLESKSYVLTVKTTVDTELQKFAQETVTNILDTEGRTVNVRQAALVSMEMDGAVRAIVGGKDYEKSQFNRATSSIRQPGSSFKPYVYLMALQTGRYRPNTYISDSYVSCGGRGIKNYDNGFKGRQPLSFHLKKSRNTVPVKLSFELGRKKLAKFVKVFGLNVVPSCTMALGDTGITPLQHTAGYAAFANGGKIVKPYAILEIRNSQQEVIYDQDKDGIKPRQVFKRRHVADLNKMLGLVVTEGTARRYGGLEFTASAGKTGTTSNYRDGWYVGYTGAFVTGVWYGNDNLAPMNRTGTGGNLPARTWQAYNIRAHADIRPRIPLIPGIPIHPKQQEEMDQYALAQGTVPKAVKLTKKVEILSKSTRRVLTDILKNLEEAKPLDKQAQINTNNEDTRLARK